MASTESSSQADRGAKAVKELDRIGALTGAADTSGTKKDIYFCHDLCELGAVSAHEVLGNIRDFLDQNLTDVVIIDIEDYVKPQDFKQALIDADLFDRVWQPKKMGKWPTLYNMVVPPNPKDEQNPRRLIVMYEKHKSPYKWLLNTYKVSEETNFFYKSAAKFDCLPKRGGTGKSFFIVNHWINPGGTTGSRRGREDELGGDDHEARPAVHRDPGQGAQHDRGQLHRQRRSLQDGPDAQLGHRPAVRRHATHRRHHRGRALLPRLTRAQSRRSSKLYEKHL